MDRDDRRRRGKRAVLEALRAGTCDEVLIAHGLAAEPGDAGRARCRAIGTGAHARGRAGDAGRARRRITGASSRRSTRCRPAPRSASGISRRSEWASDAIVVILDGVEDPQNLGAAARSIEASGRADADHRARTAPRRSTAAAVRASAGALLHLPHARVANLSRAIERLQDAGFTVIGLDERRPARRSTTSRARPGAWRSSSAARGSASRGSSESTAISSFRCRCMGRWDR